MAPEHGCAGLWCPAVGEQADREKDSSATGSDSRAHSLDRFASPLGRLSGTFLSNASATWAYFKRDMLCLLSGGAACRAGWRRRQRGSPARLRLCARLRLTLCLLCCVLWDFCNPFGCSRASRQAARQGKAGRARAVSAVCACRRLCGAELLLLNHLPSHKARSHLHHAEQLVPKGYGLLLGPSPSPAAAAAVATCKRLHRQAVGAGVSGGGLSCRPLHAGSLASCTITALPPVRRRAPPRAGSRAPWPEGATRSKLTGILQPPQAAVLLVLSIPDSFGCCLAFAPLLYCRRRLN